MGQRHARQMKALELEAEGKRPAALPAADGSAEMEARLRHLEEVVSSVDFELNAKLNRLASRQMAALPAGGPGNSAPSSDRTVGPLAAGRVVGGRFAVERPLGAGGMGAVYLAHDQQLGERVALKVIAGLAMLDPSAADRFRREATSARRIAHPNVVRIHDVDELDGFLVMSMEYVEGPSLAEMVERNGPFAPDHARGLVRQVCEGLAALHQGGVVHRDLKPHNLLVAPDGKVKIIDFGLAKSTYMEGMTATGVIQGTPEFMAPEQMKNDGTVDARTDLYALGALVVYVLTGEPPFKGANPIAVSLAQLTEPPPCMSERRPELSPHWDAFVAKAMAKDPRERFQSAAALGDAMP